MWTECFIDNVGLAVVDEDVWAGSDEFAIEPARIERGFASAIADGFDFFNRIAPSEKLSAAFKQFASEISTESVTDYRYTLFIHYIHQFFYLVCR